jgi:transposase
MSGEFWLDDRQRRRFAPLLPNKPRGVPRVDDWRVISGIVHVLRSGGRWADAPTVYGPRKTLYNRSVRGLLTASGKPCSRLWRPRAGQPRRCCSTAPM